jgi:hypothetical protein
MHFYATTGLFGYKYHAPLEQNTQNYFFYLPVFKSLEQN